MTESEVLKILHQVGAIITGSHIVYTSGQHGSSYVNKDAVYPHTGEISRLCRAIAEKFSQTGVEVVAAPALGGIILSQWTAHHLSELDGRNVLAVYAEKSGDGFVIQRGYDKLISGKKVLVVEDILTTGGSVKKVVETVRALGGQVTAVAALCNRGGVTAEGLGNLPELFALVNLQLEAWDEKECPLCAKNVPVNTSIGKGREFLAKKT